MEISAKKNFSNWSKKPPFNKILIFTVISAKNQFSQKTISSLMDFSLKCDIYGCWYIGKKRILSKNPQKKSNFYQIFFIYRQNQFFGEKRFFWSDLKKYPFPQNIFFKVIPKISYFRNVDIFGDIYKNVFLSDL